MKAQDLRTCLDLLRSYWPGEWDITRVTVWGHALSKCSLAEAKAAIHSMASTQRQATVAAFYQALQAARAPSGARFQPGSGWLSPTQPEPPRARPEVVQAALADARAKLKQARARTPARYPASPESPPSAPQRVFEPLIGTTPSHPPSTAPRALTAGSQEGSADSSTPHDKGVQGE